MTDGYDGPLAEDPDMRPAWPRRPNGGGGPASTQLPPAAPAPRAAPPEATAPPAPDTPAGAAARVAAGPIEHPDADELERGRTLAMLAALGRLQMSLDVLSRQQRQHAEQVEQRLARIERALGQRPPS